jgi:hypothetical protein
MEKAGEMIGELLTFKLFDKPVQYVYVPPQNLDLDENPDTEVENTDLNDLYYESQLHAK